MELAITATRRLVRRQLRHGHLAETERLADVLVGHPLEHFDVLGPQVQGQVGGGYRGGLDLRGGRAVQYGLGQAAHVCLLIDVTVVGAIEHRRICEGFARTEDKRQIETMTRLQFPIRGRPIEFIKVCVATGVGGINRPLDRTVAKHLFGGMIGKELGRSRRWPARLQSLAVAGRYRRFFKSLDRGIISEEDAHFLARRSDHDVSVLSSIGHRCRVLLKSRNYDAVANRPERWRRQSAALCVLRGLRAGSSLCRKQRVERSLRQLLLGSRRQVETQRVCKFFGRGDGRLLRPWQATEGRTLSDCTPKQAAR